MRIKAAVLRAADRPYEIEDVQLAEPGLGELRVRIAGAGLCHTDVLPRMPGFMATPPIMHELPVGAYRVLRDVLSAQSQRFRC